MNSTRKQSSSGKFKIIVILAIILILFFLFVKIILLFFTTQGLAVRKLSFSSEALRLLITANGSVEAEIHPIGWTPFCESKRPIAEREEELLRNPISQREYNRASSVLIHFISYGDSSFNDSRERIAQEAHSFMRFSNVTIYKPEDIPTVFSGFFRDILSYRRGGGYWIWKILAIRDAVEHVKEGEYVMYVDAGSTLVKEHMNRFHKYMIMLERSKSGILITSCEKVYNESQFSSGRLLETFGLLNASEMLESFQYWAGFIIFRRQQSVLDLLDKYLRILFKDKWIITDAYGTYKSKPDFKENRHDQSIFGLLLKCSGSVVVDDYINAWKKGAPVIPSRKKK